MAPTLSTARPLPSPAASSFLYHTTRSLLSTTGGFTQPTYYVPYSMRYNLLSGAKYDGGFVFPLGGNSGDLLDQNSAAGKYFYSLLSIGFPLWLLLVILLVLFVAFGVYRCVVCCCCRRACCPQPKPTAGFLSRFLTRFFMAFFAACVVVGAVLLYVASAEVPRAVGTSSTKGLLYTIGNALDKMVNIGTGMVSTSQSAATNLKSAVTKLNTQIVSNATLGPNPGIAFTLDATSLNNAADNLVTKMQDMENSLKAIKAGMYAPFASLNGFLNIIEIAMLITAIVIGLIGIVLGMLGILGFRFALVSGFVMSPIFTTLALLLGGAGLVIMMFFADICTDAGVTNYAIIYQGPVASNATPLGMIFACASSATFAEPLKMMFQAGNYGVVMSHFAVAMDMISVYEATNANTPTRSVVCYRFNPDCSYSVDGNGTVTLAEQCVIACGATMQAATGAPAAMKSPQDLITDYTLATNGNLTPFTNTMTENQTWTSAMGLSTANWMNPTPDPNIATYVATLSLTNADDISIHASSMDYVQDMERLIGVKGSKPDDYTGFEYLVRCMYVEEILGDLVSNNCSYTMNAFQLFWLGFGMSGFGLVFLAICFLFAMCYLDRSRNSKAQDYMEE